MRNRNRRWIFFWILVSSYFYVIICEVIETADSTKRRHDNSTSKEARSLFSPRMDYEQWKPLGRGDPLKNDPTYDYVPPVLDKVHYWIEPSQRKPDSTVSDEPKKTEVLLLGITSKKPSISTSSVADSRRDNYDPFLKFVDGPKFHSHQKIPRPHYTSSSYYSPSYYSTKNRLYERNIYAKGTEQRVPYTMLVPPPELDDNQVSIQQSIPLNKPMTLQQQKSTTIRSTPQTTSTSDIVSSVSSTTTIRPPDVTIQSANLIYHSSSFSDGSEWKNKKPYATLATHSKPPQPVTASDNVMRHESVIFQKHLRPESYIKIQSSQDDYSSSFKPLLADGSSHTVNYITPPPVKHSEAQEVMHKGQVTDDNLDESNTYVKIGKTEAQVHSGGIDDLSGMPVDSQSLLVDQISPLSHSHSHPHPHLHSHSHSHMHIHSHPHPHTHHSIMIHRPDIMMYPHQKQPMMHNDIVPMSMPPLTMQTIENMQTMQPPPMTRSPTFTRTNPILEVLEKEKNLSDPVTQPVTIYVTTTTQESYTTSPPPTTTTTSLTTDPLFKHYKQPEKPIMGPLYLIIQGHSKVKTYGPTKHIHGIPIQETNDISDDREERGMYEVRHLHGFLKESKEEKTRVGRSGNLQTLKHVVQTGLGAIDFSDIPADERLDDDDDDLKETELEAGYKVAEGKDVTSEKYHKGIVEEARNLKNFGNATEH